MRCDARFIPISATLRALRSRASALHPFGSIARGGASRSRGVCRRTSQHTRKKHVSQNLISLTLTPAQLTAADAALTALEAALVGLIALDTNERSDFRSWIDRLTTNGSQSQAFLKAHAAFSGLEAYATLAL